MHEPVTVSIAFQPAKMLPPPSDLDLNKPVPISFHLMVQEQPRPTWRHNGRINFNSPLVFGKSLHFQMLWANPEGGGIIQVGIIHLLNLISSSKKSSQRKAGWESGKWLKKLDRKESYGEIGRSVLSATWR